VARRGNVPTWRRVPCGSGRRRHHRVASSCLIFSVLSDPMQIAEVGRHGPWAQSRRVRMCRRKPLDQIVCPDFHDVRDAVWCLDEATSCLGKNQLFRWRYWSSARLSCGWHHGPPVIPAPYVICRPAFSRGVQEGRLFFETLWSALRRIQVDRSHHARRCFQLLAYPASSAASSPTRRAGGCPRKGLRGGSEAAVIRKSSGGPRGAPLVLESSSVRKLM
jgi:hypothetical protein